jgi:uncharacterized membrane protein SpoIIM required for sporulation
MVLEYLLSPQEAEKRPWELVLIAFVFVSLGVLTQLLIPALQGSVIIFALIPSIPIFYLVLMSDEAHEERYSRMKREIEEWKGVLRAVKDDELKKLPHFALWHRLKRIYSVHRSMIHLFGFYFIGAVLAYTFWFAVLPSQASYELYYPQLQEIRTLSSSVLSSQAFSQEAVEFLFYHNLQVFVLMFLFSVLYGIGALYLLLWNASIIGAVVGEKILRDGIFGVVTGFLGLIPHGIFELSSYFVVALAGGVLSVSIARSSYKKPFFKYLVEDVALLTLVALVLLAIGALIEASY